MLDEQINITLIEMLMGAAFLWLVLNVATVVYARWVYATQHMEDSRVETRIVLLLFGLTLFGIVAWLTLVLGVLSAMREQSDSSLLGLLVINSIVVVSVAVAEFVFLRLACPPPRERITRAEPAP
jgi:predicted membrane protein